MAPTYLEAWPLPILAKIPNATDLHMVLKHTDRLRGTKHFVQRQLPQDVNERKNFALPHFKAKRTDSRNKARLINDKLYIKDKLQTQFQSPKPTKVTKATPGNEYIVTAER